MRRASAACAVVAATLLCLGAAAAAVARDITVGFGDPAFNGPGRDRALGLAARANSQVVRLSVNWSVVAPQPPVSPANPADPAYRFGDVDASVRAAASRGQRVILEVGRAPAWAEGPGRPPNAAAGTWRPDPAAYGRFAAAVAARYSGSFVPAPGQPALPRVGDFQAWNEPNLSFYLTPQWSGGQPEAARIYRRLLASFYDAVKDVDPSLRVISAGTAPYGEDPGGGRTRPLTFLRELLCLRDASAATGFGEPVPLDVLAHHPINASGPFESADDPDDATTPDLGRVRRVLREAERKERVRPAGSRPIWVTEFWWESNPPDETYGVSERTHARYTAEALYLFWKQRVPLVLGLQLADDPIDPARPGDSFQTGLFFTDGKPKRALRAFRFPVVARPGRHATRVWGRSPAAGRLAVQLRRGGRWRTIDRSRVAAGESFTDRNGARPPLRVRARVAGERSLPYRVRRR